MKSQSENKSWDKYWNSTNINREIMQVWGAYFVRSYEENFSFNKSDVILDFGAGFGNVSYFLKDKVGEVFLYDKSEFMTEALVKNFKDVEIFNVIKSLKEIDKKVDVIFVNSVLQYMTPEEFKNLLGDLKPYCHKSTRLILADIIPRDYSKLSDFFSQLKLGLKFGFFWKLIVYAVSNTFFSPSLSLSSSYLTCYEENDIISILNHEKFAAEKMKSNFTLSKKRYTITCQLDS